MRIREEGAYAVYHQFVYPRLIALGKRVLSAGTGEMGVGLGVGMISRETVGLGQLMIGSCVQIRLTKRASTYFIFLPQFSDVPMASSSLSPFGLA